MIFVCHKQLIDADCYISAPYTFYKYYPQLFHSQSFPKKFTDNIKKRLTYWNLFFPAIHCANVVFFEKIDYQRGINFNRVLECRLAIRDLTQLQ